MYVVQRTFCVCPLPALSPASACWILAEPNERASLEVIRGSLCRITAVNVRQLVAVCCTQPRAPFPPHGGVLMSTMCVSLNASSEDVLHHIVKAGQDHVA